MIGLAKWHLAGDRPGRPGVVNVCQGHDPALAGLYRGITAFSAGLGAPILSVEPTTRLYGPCAGEVFRLEATGGFSTCTTQYVNRSADSAAEPLLRDARLLIVHSLFRGHVGFGMRWAEQRDRDYWVVPHGCWDPWGMANHGSRKRLWMTAVGQRYVANTNCVIFASRREAEKAARWTRSARTAVVHFPVQLPDLARKDAAKESLRQKLGLADGMRVLISVGRLHSMKRPHAILQAFLQAGTENLALVFVGGDDDVTRAELARAVPPAVAERIRFTGVLAGEALEEAFLGADGFVSLSYRENFGFSLAEACAYGLPVIVTPGHDLVHEMPTVQGAASGVGWCLPDMTRAAASEAFQAFAAASDKQLRWIGQTARQWAAEELHPDDFRLRLLALMA